MMIPREALSGALERMVIETTGVAALLTRMGTKEDANLTEEERIAMVPTTMAAPPWKRSEKSEYLKVPLRRKSHSRHHLRRVPCRLQIFHDQGRVMLALLAVIVIVTTHRRICLHLG